MQALNNAAEMVEGGVYNIVYTGPNEAYARINGKRTIRVIRVGQGTLKYIVLHDQFGRPDPETCTTNGLLHTSNLESAFKEDEIYEAPNPDDWFVKSLLFKGLEEAVAAGVLSEEMIKEHPVKSSYSPFVSVSGRDGKFTGLHTRFGVEDATDRPHLQSVYVWWSTWEEMYADYEKYGIEARR